MKRSSLRWTFPLVALTAVGGCRHHGGLSQGTLDASAPEVRVAEDAASDPDSPPRDASSVDAKVDAEVDAEVDADVDAEVGDAGPVPEVRSYRVRMHVVLSTGNLAIPDQELTITVIPTTPPSIVMSVPGAMAHAAATISDDGQYEATGPLVLPDQTLADRCTTSLLTYTGLLVSLDADTLRGQMKGVYDFFQGDFGSSSLFDGTLGGTRDRDPPTVSLANSDPPTSAGGVSPMARVRFVANKPLKAGVTASLRGSDGSERTLSPEGTDPDAFIAFATDGAAAKLGTTYDLAFSAPLADLAGNVGAAPVVRIGAADPGFLAFDGFEGALAAVSNQVLGSSDQLGVPPIAGQKSLALWSSTETDNYVLMHAKVDRTSAAVLFRYRGVSEIGSPFGTLEVRLAAPGGAPTSQSFALWAPGDDGQVVMTSRGKRNLSAIKAASLALPTGTVDEVLIELRMPMVCPSPTGSELFALIDDVSVE